MEWRIAHNAGAGTMTFGGKDGGIIGVLEQQDAEKLVAHAIAGGINFIDTADIYSGGASEVITGQALKNLKVKREDVIVATKVFGRSGEGPNARGASRGHIMDNVKGSLKRLQLDHIDLYQIHGFDAATPIEETVRAMETLIQQGHVRYIGVSNWAAWQIMKALGIADRLGMTRFSTLQAYYTIAGRDIEREIVPLLKSEGVGLLVWSPLAGGFLSGKFTREKNGGNDSRRSTFDFPPLDRDRAFDAIEVMRKIANAMGVSVAQIALAWLRYQPQVTSVIIGAKRIEQLQDNLDSINVTLSTEDLAALDAVSQLPSEYPRWMIQGYGGESAELLKNSKH